MTCWVGQEGSRGKASGRAGGEKAKGNGAAKDTGRTEEEDGRAKGAGKVGHVMDVGFLPLHC